ncbi:MAG TPA: hypothetical protein VK252_09925 [Solirubrobacteraceae bacterium]|nr:hypothetical protein [Solirubrobacteraceae bacterium]
MTESLAALDRRVGNPTAKWGALKDEVQGLGTLRFVEVQDAWLDLMWTLDAYRIAQVLPAGFKDFGAFNRGKGNWFAELVCQLLRNRTHDRLGARQKVSGFSQRHQIDVAWPARGEDPLVCCETKVTGAPAFGSTPARGAMSDFSNRRKELKFAATDLKLYRRQDQTKIAHWDVWRRSEPPKAYFLWAARLEPGKDRIEALVREARALIDTYLDGAGLFAWRLAPGGDGYEHVVLAEGERVTSLDDVLYRIASEIESLLDDKGRPPPPVRPARLAVDAPRLAADQE